MPVLLILFVLLTACVAMPLQESPRAYAIRICDATPHAASIHREFMRQCVAMETNGLNSGGAGYLPIMPYASVYSGPMPSAYSRADAFGPYGYRGPTWEQFNHQFQGY